MSRTPSEIAGELRTAVRKQAKALRSADRANRMKLWHVDRADAAYLEAAALTQELTDALAFNIDAREYRRMQATTPRPTGEQVMDAWQRERMTAGEVSP